MFHIELYGAKNNPAKSAQNLGVIFDEKVSLSAHIYQQSAAHAFTKCGICGVFSVIMIWIAQTYL